MGRVNTGKREKNPRKQGREGKKTKDEKRNVTTVRSDLTKRKESNEISRYYASTKTHRNIHIELVLSCTFVQSILANCKASVCGHREREREREREKEREKERKREKTVEKVPLAS